MVETLMKKQLFAGKFEIQGEISKGQTGTIYYGYDMGLRQEVAIKIYHSHINGRLIRGQAFIEKSKPLLLLDHPNLIKVFKVEEEDDTPIVFMEFFDAPSLQQMIRDKSPLPVSDMLMLAREITEVLVHTHFQGIIHGTLHPGHVLVSSQGQIKVMDLGLSWILKDILSNCDEELFRPLPYFPPEIAKGELLNVSSDLYCLGFMMYEMLTGTVPYAGLPKTSIMGKLAFDQADPTFEFPEGVPEVICDLIREMTRNKTQQRLQDATHVLTIINQQLSKLPLSHTHVVSTPVATQLPPPPPKLSPDPEPELEPKAPLRRTTPPDKPESLLKTTRPDQPPQTSMDYDPDTYTKMLRNIGIGLGLIVLVGLAGVLGYWYRDELDPQIPVLQTPSEDTAQETMGGDMLPGQNPIPLFPTESPVNFSQPLSETTEPLTHKAHSTQAPTIDPAAGPTLNSQEPEITLDQPTFTEPSFSNKIDQDTSLPTTQSQLDSTQTFIPAEEPSSKRPPAISEIAPLPTEETTQIDPTNIWQKPGTPTSTNEAISPATPSVQSESSPEKLSEELTDQEIDELLQALDETDEELSRLTVP